MVTAFLRSARFLIPLMLFAITASPAGGSGPAGNPRLASLQIEVWPEFDRPAAALVILRGEIATGVALPAAISLRIPATTGGPSAVAYSAGANGDVLNLKYSRSDAGDFITLNFDAPTRHFHVEFYDRLLASGPARSYAYGWTGDLAADRIKVILQEPATASDFSVQPALDATTLGQDGLRYRSADLGPRQAGEPLEMQVRYSKTDARTSTEILKSKAPDASPPALAGPGKAELAIWLIAVVAALVMVGIAASTWWTRRKRVPAPGPEKSGFCRKCRAPMASGDRFCSKCGAPVK